VSRFALFRTAKTACGASLFLLTFCASNAYPQAQQPSSYEGFEGRSVTKVDISANSAMDIESFRALLTVEAGQPFSLKAMRESVDALQKTNLFSQVQVSVEPEQAGLRVLFILQPAPYVGLIEFPGAVKAFPYTRLLQAVNIPDQTAFVPDLLPKGKAALLHLFETEGYFIASVETEAHKDDARHIVDIVFRCQLGPHAKIGSVALQGVSGETADELHRALDSLGAKLKGASLTPRATYSQERLRKSLEYIRTNLQNSGHLTPNVRLASSSYHAEKNRADVTFDVQPGPIVSIRVTGAKVSKRAVKRLIPIYEENSVDSELVAEGGRNLVNYFQSKSYFDTKVASHLDQKPDLVTILYDVQRGSKHKVEAIRFEGNHHFTDKQLAAHILIKEKRFFFYRGDLSNDLLHKSVASLTALYKNEGFVNVNVSPEVRDHEPAIDITFRISEGEQDKVQSLRIVDRSDKEVQPKLGKYRLNLGPGKPYSPELLEKDRNQIVAEYLNHGYLNARFDSHVSRAAANPHLVDVVYVIDEGNLAHVGQVSILGADKIHRSFIRSVTDPNVEEGQPLSEANFLTAESDLYNLGVFDWTSVGPLRPVSDQTQEEVLIKVHESKRNTMDVGGGIEVIPRSGNIPVGAVALPGLPAISLGSKFTTSQKSFFGPRVTFQFARRDLFGKAETAQLGLVFSRLDQRGTLSYTDPHLQGSSWSSLLSVTGERTTENPIYTAALGQASLQFEKSFDRKRTRLLRFRYSYQKTDLTNITIPDLVLPQDQHVRTSTFAVEYVRDSRDDPLDARHGIFQTFTIGVTPIALGSSSNFVRFLGQTSLYKPIRPWLIWANNFRFGVVPPFAGSYVPLSELFFSGGPDSLRGFPINGAGPQRPVSVCSNPSDPSTCSLISVPVGGEMLAIWNSEARFPIPLKKGLGGVIFYDGGNVYSNISLRQFTNNYSNSVGVGLRYQTPVGPIRFDIGRNLNPIPGVKATQYFVTVGQAF
jgi:outer membrane protein insertion porin family